MLNGGVFGDPETALLAAFDAYKQDLETATAMAFATSLTPLAFIDTVPTDLFGGVLTVADADFIETLDMALADRLRSGETITLTGTVETDFWRIDALFQAVPEPSILMCAASGAVVLTFAVACRRLWRCFCATH